MDKNYQIEPKNYDNPEEFQKEKKRGILALKQYLELNARQYYDLSDQTTKIKRYTKSERNRRGRDLENITGTLRKTFPFAFGKSSKLKQIENEIRYLSKKG
jgi:hypothetical protein